MAGSVLASSTQHTHAHSTPAGKRDKVYPYHAAPMLGTSRAGESRGVKEGQMWSEVGPEASVSTKRQQELRPAAWTSS